MARLGLSSARQKTPVSTRLDEGDIHKGQFCSLAGSADPSQRKYAQEFEDGKPRGSTARPDPNVGGRQKSRAHCPSGDSNGWSNVQQIIAWIEGKQFLFYTLVGGRKAYVGVRRDIGKAPYIRTYADGVWNDNLLALQRAA